MKRYGLFQNCCNNTENAAAAKRHNTTIEPAAALKSSTRFTAAPSPRSARDIARPLCGTKHRDTASHFVSSSTVRKRQWPINQSASTMGLATNDSWESGASSRVKLSSTGLRQSQVCDGSTLAAAMAPSEMLVERCAPVSVQGIDPSEGQLAFARTRPAARMAQFRQGNAMSQPFTDDTFDVAVMPLVIFFVPDPAKGVAEMVRVVCPGGTVTAYAWDMHAGGFPYEALKVEMRALGINVPLPPSSGRHE